MKEISKGSWVALFVALLVTVWCAWALVSDPLKPERKVGEDLVIIEERVAGAEEQARYIDRQLSAMEASLPKPTPTPTPKIVKKE